MSEFYMSVRVCSMCLCMDMTMYACKYVCK